jgi:hypothetical protein
MGEKLPNLVTLFSMHSPMSNLGSPLCLVQPFYSMLFHICSNREQLLRYILTYSQLEQKRLCPNMQQVYMYI